MIQKDSDTYPAIAFFCASDKWEVAWLSAFVAASVEVPSSSDLDSSDPELELLSLSSSIASVSSMPIFLKFSQAGNADLKTSGSKP